MRRLLTKKRMVSLGLLAILLFALVPVALAWPFADVPVGYWAYNAIRRIAYLNITAGCGGGNFCPEAYVTRAQMAGFMNNLTNAWTDQDEPYIINMDHRDILANRPAIIGRSNDGNGVNGISYGAGYADNGVYGSTNSSYSYEAGVYGYSSDLAAGVLAYNGDPDTATTTSYGLYAYSVNGNGIYADGGAQTTDYGGYFIGTQGIRAEATSQHAVYGHTTSANYTAAVFDSDGYNGVYAIGGGSLGSGVWAESDQEYGYYANTYLSGGYGLYTPDAIYAGGGCVGCTSMIIARNGGEEALQPGEVVAVVGIAQGPSEYYARPVLLVRRADATTQTGIVGVVQGRYESELVSHQLSRMTAKPVEIVDPEAEKNGEDAHPPQTVYVDEETIEERVVPSERTTTDPAAPGDLMTVVYRGLIQVRVDASLASIQVGDRLAMGNTGLALKAEPALEGTAPSGPVLGLALEPLTEGQGLIWVLVDLQ